MNKYYLRNLLVLATLAMTLMLSCKTKDESRNTPFTLPTNSIVPYIDPNPADQIGEYVRNIFQDKEGNLWMGTNGYGVAMYDGKELKYFNPSKGLGGAQVTDVIQAHDGRMWITTNGGVSVYDGKSFTNYTAKDGLPTEWMWSVYEDSKGQIWAGGIEGLSKLEGDKFINVAILGNGVYYKDERFKAQWVRDLMEIDGELWIATANLGICIYDGKEYRYLNSENGLCDNDISCMMRDSKGNIWVGTRFGGVCKYDGTLFQTFDIDNGIENNEVIKVYEDSKGFIWFSSEGYGLYRYDGSDTLTNYAENEGLGVRAVQTILEDREGRFWTGGGGGLYRLYGDNFVNVTKHGPWEK